MPDSPPILPTAPYAIADFLSDLQISCIEEDATLGGKIIAGRLQKLRDAVWKKPVASERIQPDNKMVFTEAVEGLNPTQRKQLFEAYAQMGHLNEIANLAERENYFLGLKHIPGGVEEFLEKQNGSTIATVVEKLNQPVFEPVLTAHPTNVNSKESMRAQREIGMALHSWMRKESGAGTEKVKDAVKAYAHASLLNHGANGVDKNFTVRDETQMVINSLSNIYDDLPRIYAEYDGPLRAKSMQGDAYDPASLKLRLRFKSWGSAGDKDGNKKVTAEKTLEAIGMHTQAIVERYLTDLNTIEHPLTGKWKELLDKTNRELNTILPSLVALSDDADLTRAGEKTMTASALADRFDTLSKQLAKLREGLPIEDFRNDLLDMHKATQDKDSMSPALQLLRKARIFGFEFAKIEYRETAEEYTRVVDVITKPYHGIQDDPIKRLETLTRILQEPGRAKVLYEKVKGSIQKGATSAYSKEDAAPIAYHTMKRMELARDHPTMFEDNVLAECGKTGAKNMQRLQGAIHMLEAQFVQQAAMGSHGKRPLLGIVPLFEEPETMECIDTIIKGAYDNKAYQQHLQLLAEQRHGGKSTQQIQIAQSDNARRAGIPAARAFIHEAHKKIYELNEQYGICGQFFVGGSISDAYRNGVRALSASVNAFGMHKFAKFTFQGGDTLNYFNQPFSNTRLFTRQILHSADKLIKTDIGWAVVQDKEKCNNVLDMVAIRALKDALYDYRQHDFTEAGLGTLLAALQYNRESAAGSLASRSAERNSNTDPAQPNTQAMKAMNLTPVNMEDLRTIGFSEAMQHNDLLPSWIGAGDLTNHLKIKIIRALDQIVQDSASPTYTSDDETKEFFKAFKNIAKNNSGSNLTATQLHMFYDKSPTFRDAIDKFGYGIAMSDMDRLSARINAAKNMVPGGQQVEYKNNLDDYKARLKLAYTTVGKMVYEARTGKEYKSEDFTIKNGKPGILRYDSETARIAQAVTESLENLSSDIQRKVQYRAFPVYAKDECSGLTTHDDKVLHAALDTVVHGRIPRADDPIYGKSLSPNGLTVSVTKSIVGQHTGRLDKFQWPAPFIDRS